MSAQCRPKFGRNQKDFVFLIALVAVSVKVFGVATISAWSGSLKRDDMLLQTHPSVKGVPASTRRYAQVHSAKSTAKASLSTVEHDGRRSQILGNLKTNSVLLGPAQTGKLNQIGDDNDLHLLKLEKETAEKAALDAETRLLKEKEENARFREQLTAAGVIHHQVASKQKGIGHSVQIHAESPRAVTAPAHLTATAASRPAQVVRPRSAGHRVVPRSHKRVGKYEVVDGSLSMTDGDDMAAGVLANVRTDSMADGILNHVPSDSFSATAGPAGTAGQKETVEGSLAVSGGERDNEEMVSGDLAAVSGRAAAAAAPRRRESPAEAAEDRDGSLAVTRDDDDVTGSLAHLKADRAAADGVLAAVAGDGTGGVLSAVDGGSAPPSAFAGDIGPRRARILRRLRRWERAVRELGRVETQRLNAMSRSAAEAGSAAAAAPAAEARSHRRGRRASLVKAAAAAPSDGDGAPAWDGGAFRPLGRSLAEGPGTAGSQREETNEPDVGWEKKDWSAAGWTAFVIMGPLATAAVTGMVGWFAGTVAAVCTCVIMVAMDTCSYYYSWYTF
jgi:hypothetical protein